jgi:protocatechuate 3,4-dioxygenase beta subunit
MLVIAAVVVGPIAWFALRSEERRAPAEEQPSPPGEFARRDTGPDPVRAASPGAVTQRREVRRGVVGDVRERASGEPVAGALVRAVAASAAPDASTAPCARTDGDGAFRIDLLDQDIEYCVEIAECPGGFAAEDDGAVRVRPTTETSRVQLWACRTGRIFGTVMRQSITYHPNALAFAPIATDGSTAPSPRETDARQGQRASDGATVTEEPLAGVEISLQRLDRSDRTPVPEIIRTDEEGVFAFEHVPPGRYAARAAPPPGLPRFGREDGRVRKLVFLSPGGSASIAFSLPGASVAAAGRVVDVEGRPVADAEIVARTMAQTGHSQGESYGESPSIEVQRVETDALGRYDLTALPPLGFNEAWEYATTGTCSMGMIDLELRARGFAPAHLVFPVWMPVLDEMISAMGEWARRGVDELHLRETVDQPWDNAVRPEFRDGALTLPDVVLLRASTLSGVVLRSGGGALGGAKIKADPTADSIIRPFVPAPCEAEWSATDANGRFHLAEVAPGPTRFLVQTEVAGICVALEPPLEVLPGEDQTDLVVTVADPHVGQIAVTVIDAITGESVKAFDVEVANSGGSTIEHGEGGRFILEGVPAGRARVQVRAAGYAPAQHEVVVRAADTVQTRSPLLRAGIVEGSARLQGEPVQGTLNVFAEDGSERQLHHGWLDGRFRVADLEGGVAHRFVLLADLPGKVTSQVVEAKRVVPVGGETMTLDFDLWLPASSIEGSVDYPAGALLWRVHVLAGGDPPPTDPDRSPRLCAISRGRAEDSKFVLPVPPGEYTVLASTMSKDASGQMVVEGLRTESVSVGAGEAAKVDFLFP